MSKYFFACAAIISLLLFGACGDNPSDPAEDDYPLPENGNLAIYQTGGMHDFRPVEASVDIPGYGRYYDISFKYSGYRLQAMHYYQEEELVATKAFFYSLDGKLENIRINGYNAYNLDYNDDGNLEKLVLDRVDYEYTTEYEYFGDKIISFLSYTRKNTKYFDSTVTRCVYDDSDRPLFMIDDGFGDVNRRDDKKTRFDFSGDRVVAVTDSTLGDIYTVHAATRRTFEYNPDGSLKSMDPHMKASHFVCEHKSNVMTKLDCREEYFNYSISIGWQDGPSNINEVARYAQSEPHINGIISNDYNMYFLILFF